MTREAIELGTWLATWVVRLIDDGRIDDLSLDDEYVEWARKAKAIFLELRRLELALEPCSCDHVEDEHLDNGTCGVDGCLCAEWEDAEDEEAS